MMTLVRKIAARVAAGAAAALPVVAFAQAAPGSQFQGVFTDTQAAFGTVLGYGVTLLGVVLVGMLGLKLVKKIANRAT